MNVADAERQSLTKLLAEVGPDRPTLCAGWDTYDLAAHLWTRENDPISLPGIAISALSGLTQRRLAAAKRRYAYPELVRRLANPPIWTRPMAVANGAEFFIHRLDVVRANPDVPETPVAQAESDQLWPYAKVLGRRLRGGEFGVVLQRADAADSVRIAPGAQTATLVGSPGELLMLLSGRGSHANIEFVGTTAALDWVKSKKLGL